MNRKYTHWSDLVKVRGSLWDVELLVQDLNTNDEESEVFDDFAAICAHFSIPFTYDMTEDEIMEVRAKIQKAADEPLPHANDEIAITSRASMTVAEILDMIKSDGEDWDETIWAFETLQNYFGIDDKPEYQDDLECLYDNIMDAVRTA